MKPKKQFVVGNAARRRGTPATLALLAALLLVPCAFGQESGEWIDLSDGQSLAGWTKRGGAANYEIENGEIVGTTSPNTPNTFLCTDKDYGNFVLEFDCLVHPELNSGVQIRSSSLDDYQEGRVHGYQIEIDPSDRAWSGGIYDEGRRGWLNDLKNNNEARHAFRQNDWNHFRVEAVGDSIRTWINGVLAADLFDDMTPSGFIGLQVHGVGGRTDPIQVRWRKLRLMPLADDARPIEMKHRVAFEPPAQVLADDAVVTKIADGFAFAEGPALGPDGRIWFTDIPAARIHVFDPATGATEVFRQESGNANGLMWTAADALIACEGGNRCVTRQLMNGEPRVLADSFDGKKLNSPNDLELDNEGGVYFTDPRYGDRTDLEQPVEGVYYLQPRGGELLRIIDNLERPNGIALSPDCQTLYVADQAAGKTWRYPLESAGKPGTGTVLVEMGSDGMTVDAGGNLYLTDAGKVHVVSPTGEVIEEIRVPEPPSNVTFGGRNGSVLFITAGSSLYQVPTQTRGSANMNQ